MPSTSSKDVSPIDLHSSSLRTSKDRHGHLPPLPHKEDVEDGGRKSNYTCTIVRQNWVRLLTLGTPYLLIPTPGPFEIIRLNCMGEVSGCRTDSPLCLIQTE